jgi:hypothetical protein
MRTLSLRLEDDLHEAVRECASDEDRSLNWMINELVRRGLAWTEREEAIS